jgi:hypothetical protein
MGIFSGKTTFESRHTIQRLVGLDEAPTTLSNAIEQYIYDANVPVMFKLNVTDYLTFFKENSLAYKLEHKGHWFYNIYPFSTKAEVVIETPDQVNSFTNWLITEENRDVCKPIDVNITGTVDYFSAVYIHLAEVYGYELRNNKIGGNAFGFEVLEGYLDDIHFVFSKPFIQEQLLSYPYDFRIYADTTKDIPTEVFTFTNIQTNLLKLLVPYYNHGAIQFGDYSSFNRGRLSAPSTLTYEISEYTPNNEWRTFTKANGTYEPNLGGNLTNTATAQLLLSVKAKFIVEDGVRKYIDTLGNYDFSILQENQLEYLDDLEYYVSTMLIKVNLNLDLEYICSTSKLNPDLLFSEYKGLGYSYKSPLQNTGYVFMFYENTLGLCELFYASGDLATYPSLKVALQTKTKVGDFFPVVPLSVGAIHLYNYQRPNGLRVWLDRLDKRYTLGIPKIEQSFYAETHADKTLASSFISFAIPFLGNTQYCRQHIFNFYEKLYRTAIASGEIVKTKIDTLAYTDLSPYIEVQPRLQEAIDTFLTKHKNHVTIVAVTCPIVGYNYPDEANYSSIYFYLVNTGNNYDLGESYYVEAVESKQLRAENMQVGIQFTTGTVRKKASTTHTGRYPTIVAVTEKTSLVRDVSQMFGGVIKNEDIPIFNSKGIPHEEQSYNQKQLLATNIKAIRALGVPKPPMYNVYDGYGNLVPPPTEEFKITTFFRISGIDYEGNRVDFEVSGALSHIETHRGLVENLPVPFLPIDRSSIGLLPFKRREFVYAFNMHLFTTHVIVTKQKWHQTAWFKIVIIIVVAIISFFTAGAGSGVAGALLGAGATATSIAIMSIIVNIVVSLALSAIMEALQGTFLGTVVQIVAIIYGGYQAFNMALTQGILAAVRTYLMVFLKAMGQVYQKAKLEQLKALASSNEDLKKEYETLQQKMEDRDSMDSKKMLTSSPMTAIEGGYVIPGENFDSMFNRLINLPQASDMTSTVANLPERVLRLPTLDDTVRGIYSERSKLKYE